MTSDVGPQDGLRPPLPRVALVTGGSRGIGAQIVRELATAGMGVCFTYLRNRHAATELVRQMIAEGTPRGAVLAIRADATDESAMTRAFDAAESLGPLEVLINNAGSTGRIAPFAEGSNDETRRVLDVNLMGPILGCRMAVRRWGRQGQGRCIVNISSVAATTGAPGEYIPYAAAKAGVEALTIGLARELGPAGVRVNAVSPGTTDTDLHATAGEPGRAARVASRVPLGRAAVPREVARAALWLTSDDASYVSGAVLRVAGGL